MSFLNNEHHKLGNLSFIMFRPRYERPGSGKRQSLIDIENDDDIVLDNDKRITFSWSNINVSTKEKNERRLCGLLPTSGKLTPEREILRNASGSVAPGELLAIMGSSGAGKSTLLNTLLDRNNSDLKVSGERRINNKLVGKKCLRSVSAYVQQEELFIGTLTVKEHLIFQARVRMDPQTSSTQRMQKVESTLDMLGLTKAADTLIGIPGRIDGISGGEKKRLAFAAEILTNPALLFCDEPTSGLDAFMAHSLVQILRTLASQGRTIVCTIHQPSSSVYTVFDKILLLAEGRTAFLGRQKEALEFFEGLGKPCPVNYNPADHFIQELAVQPEKAEESRKVIKDISEKFKISIPGKDNEKSVAEFDRDIKYETQDSEFGSPIGLQFKALLWRSWLSNSKEPMVTRVKIAQNIIISLVLGLLYYGQDLDEKGIMNINGVLFITITNMTFSNMYMVINIFCLEIPIFLNDYFNGLYRSDIYFISKHIVELPLLITFPAIFISILYFMIGLNNSFNRFLLCLLTLELTAQCAVSFGYFISCLSKNPHMANAMSGPVILPLMLFGGFFINDLTIPSWISWLKYISWFRYSNEAILVNQWHNISGIHCESSQNQTESCGLSGDTILDEFGFNSDNFVMDLIMLVVLTFLFKCLAFMALYLKTRKR